MRLLWTLLKVALVLALVVPVGIVVLGLALGILGTLFGLAVFVLKLAILGLLAYGALRLVSRLFFGGGTKRPKAEEIKALSPAPPVDRHYEAALRELDRELGTTR